jgi:hypothetical protein
MAETARFELAVPITRYDGLANRWFQPLTHVSGLVASGRYSGAMRGDQHPVENDVLAGIDAFWRGIDSVRRALDCRERFEGVYRKPLNFCRWRLT